MDDLLKVFFMAIGFGIVASLIGALVAIFGKSNDDRLQVGNASGVGFLVGSSVGAFIGIFETIIGRL